MGDILDPIFGENGMAVLIGLVVAVLFIAGAYWFIRRSARDTTGSVRGRPPRLAVVESIAVDGKRQLVLVRRDGVEHLLLVGGPTDVVVEPTILRNRQRPSRSAAATAPAANAPQPAPPPPAERPAERAAARLRSIRAKKPALSESRSTDRPVAKKSEARQEAESQRQLPPSRPLPTTERGPPPPAAATPEPATAETLSQPDTLQAALAAAEAHEPETDSQVTVVEAASPEERYKESPTSPFAPKAQNQTTTQSPFAPNREPQVLPTPAPATEEPVRPAPGAAPQGHGETGAQAKVLEKDMARLLGQISEDRRSENS